ncbi:MAG TPA: glycosyltransferase family 2 protein [Thermoanaerobaculia bacterium]|nr:glycosyltransferase family 2 protein [Thermoanaerobaculia bacterium]
MAGVTVSAVVPTLGCSPWLIPCLEALRREGAEVIVVDQGETAVELPAGLADRVLRPGRNLGFAGGTNLGIAAASAALIATVNDDALVEPGWVAALTAALDADPRVAAVQGVTFQMDHPERADGCGLAWNRWWQAVQIGHGRPAPAATEPSREIFGVSATVALFRRAALEAVAVDGNVFDPRLVSYYEDVELAVRLREAGWRALLVPAARARHAGSATGETMSRERWRLIYGNRWLAAARLLGRGFWPHVPWMFLRDLVDLAHAAGSGEGARAGGIAAGWARAARRLPGFVHARAPLVR